MNYCIITGQSKGLGEAIAYELMKKMFIYSVFPAIKMKTWKYMQTKMAARWIILLLI